MEGKDYSSQTEAEARFEGICEREGQNALALVLDDLERLGYAVKAFVISASAFDAPHLRKRIWIVAHAESEQSPSRDYRTEPRIFSQPEQVEFRGSDSEGMRSSHWAVEPDVGRVAHGIPRRVDRLRGLGNAVVPQIVEWIGKMIMEVRNENTIL